MHGIVFKHVILARLVALLALTAPTGLSYAQTDYPSKAVTMTVPFPPGGRTDVIGRLVAQHLAGFLDKSVVVVNKPGAGGAIGSNEVARARPDGYTLGFFSSAIVSAQYIVPTSPALADFELVSIVNTDPAALAVQATAPWKTLKDLVAHARQNPETLRIGMVTGGTNEIFAVGFARAANVKMINVPYRGDADGALALAGGHIEVHVSVPVSYKNLVGAKKVRILAVAAESSSSLYGGLPTFRENGIDLVIGAMHAVFVPKGTPPSIVGKLADALQKTMAAPELLNTMGELGASIEFLQGSEAKGYLARQDSTYKTIIEDLGLRVAPAR